MSCTPRLAIVALALITCACPSKPAEPAKVIDAGPPATASALKRPPHPNLATAAYGQRVVEVRVGALAAGVTAQLSDVITALHELAPGAEQRAVALAMTVARDARTDRERATALALAAAALVLDPVVDGYQERLTDAFGLASYAGTVDQSDTTAQAARALVGAAAGSVEQARRLVKGIEESPAAATLSADARLLVALTRRVLGERGDALIGDLRAVLSANQQSLRARALLAEQLLELGLTTEAIEAAGSPPAVPWLAAITARARVLAGDTDAGIAALREVEPKVEEGRRGDVLYWLARSLTQKPDTVAEVQGIASALAPRPGYAKESQVLQALLAQQAGDYAKARSILEPLVQGAPRQNIDIDALWLLVDACAGQGELPCVERIGGMVLAYDGDEGRLQVARAAAVLVGGADQAAADTVVAAFREAHRLTPFDPQLAARVGEPAVKGGAVAASRLRAARRALARGDAHALVAEALAPIKDPACRVCRALLVAATSDPAEGGRRALKALEGAGPPLAESDLLRVIDALGGFAGEPARQALAELEQDQRLHIKQAVTRAQADLQNPAARAARIVGGKDPHGQGHGP